MRDGLNITGAFFIIFFLVFLLFGICIVGGAGLDVYFNGPTKQEEVYCLVDKKDTRVTPIGKSCIRRYYITVHTESDKNIKEELTISAYDYNKIKVGDSILCTVYYTKDKVKNICLETYPSNSR